MDMTFAARKDHRFPTVVTVVAVLGMGCFLGVSGAQGAEEIDFDRPESWAMKYFASVTIPTQMGIPEVRAPWTIDMDLELGWIPHLSEEQRRVGFNGVKEEDLNRSPVMIRPRFRVGLPGGFGLDLSWVPPVEVQGVKSNLFSIAVDRGLWQGERWSVGARIYAQVGETTGDFTCPEGVSTYPPGDPENIWGCEAASSDTVSMDYFGFAVTGGYRLNAEGTRALFFGAGTTSMDLVFQTDAVTYGFHDRTRLETDGWTSFVNVGFSWDAWERSRFSVEAFYSPLDVRRPGETTKNDPLFNIRALYKYRFDRKQ